MVQISWGQLFSPMTYLNVTKKINIPRATCFVVSVVSGRKCLSRGSSEEEGTEESLITQSLFTMPMILFMREFLIGTSESRRNALLGVATPVVASVVRLRWMKKLTASEVISVFVPEKEKNKTKKTSTTKTLLKTGKHVISYKKFIENHCDDKGLVNAFSVLVFAASVMPEDLRENEFKFGIDAVQLPKLNMPRVGNFFVFDVYSAQNETLFGGRGQGFKYNLFLTPRYLAFDLPRYAFKQFKQSKLAKAKCIVKSQKFGFELDLIETFNPFTLPQRLFFRASKVVGRVGNAVIAKPAQMAQRQFVRTVLRREPRAPRQLTFFERLQVMLGLADPEQIANEPESPRSSLLPFSKPEAPSSKSASKNGSKRGSKASSKAASGRSTPALAIFGSNNDESTISGTNKNDKNNKNNKTDTKKDSTSYEKASSSASVSKKKTSNDAAAAASSASDLTQLLPRLKSFSEIKEDVDSFFQGTPEEQAARKKTQEEAKKKLEQEQKKKQKELAQKRERELKEQKKKAQEEERLRELAEADGRRMVEVNDSYFNRYVPDVAETLPAFKAPSAVEVPKK
ncbi:unnamed protein product [Bathycoccus prasinos]